MTTWQAPITPAEVVIMALVDYSDSDSESERPIATTRVNEAEESPQQRKRHEDHQSNDNAAVLPPLPSSFHSLYATNVRTSTIDEPELHGGRKRQLPHIEGNWPTHVYLECE